MKNPIASLSFVLCSLIAVSTVGIASDRVHTGQWETTIESGGRTHTMKSCVTPEEAQVMNGDESTLKAGIEKAAAPTGCKVTALKASGNQVTVSSQCAIGANTGTTTYRGDSYESENTNGTKVHAKRIGACP